MVKITAFHAFNLSTEGRDFELSDHPYGEITREIGEK